MNDDNPQAGVDRETNINAIDSNVANGSANNTRNNNTDTGLNDNSNGGSLTFTEVSDEDDFTDVSRVDIVPSERFQQQQQPSDETKLSAYTIDSNENKSFKRHFPDLGDNEVVVGVASCALERDVLWHGKILLTHNYLCFYGKLFKKAARIVIPWLDVLTIEKKSTVGMFPNAIRLTTLHEKYIFTSFVRRDFVYLKMCSLWESYHLIKNFAVPPSREELSTTKTVLSMQPTSNENLNVDMFKEAIQPAERSKSNIIIMHETVERNISRARPSTPMKKVRRAQTSETIITPAKTLSNKKVEEGELNKESNEFEFKDSAVDVDETNTHTMQQSFTRANIIGVLVFLMSLIWSVYILFLLQKFEGKLISNATILHIDREEFLSLLKRGSSHGNPLDLEAIISQLYTLKARSRIILDLMEAYMNR